MASMFLAPTLTPHGHLVLVEDSAAAATDSEVGQRLRDAFARGPGHGLLQLGAGEAGTAIPPGLSYWRGGNGASCSRPPPFPPLAGAGGHGARNPPPPAAPEAP